MKTNLPALLVGVAMLTGAGIAQADTMTQKGVQPLVTTAENAQSSGPVPLTEGQMEELTAGHYTGKWHYGWYRNKHHDWKKGWHFYDYGPHWYHGKKWRGGKFD